MDTRKTIVKPVKSQLTAVANDKLPASSGKKQRLKVKVDRLRSIIMTIAKLAGDNNGYLVGGVIRDFIMCNKPFNDVDIHFTDVDSSRNFTDQLTSLPEVVNVQLLRRFRVDRISIHQIRITTTEFSIDLDVVVRLATTGSGNGGSGGSGGNNSVVVVEDRTDQLINGCDFLVNGLTYDGCHLRHVLDSSGSSDNKMLRQALAQLKSRLLVPTNKFYLGLQEQPDYYQERLQKFIGRGWHFQHAEDVDVETRAEVDAKIAAVSLWLPSS